MTKEDLTAWALKNGFKLTAGNLTLAKPNRPADIIVRIVLKATVANLEIKKPSGKWEKMRARLTGILCRMRIRMCRAGLGWSVFRGWRS
jgi:hypothetical protein